MSRAGGWGTCGLRRVWAVPQVIQGSQLGMRSRGACRTMLLPAPTLVLNSKETRAGRFPGSPPAAPSHGLGCFSRRRPLSLVL